MNTITLSSFDTTKYKPGDYPSKQIGPLIDSPTKVLAPNGKLLLYYTKMPKHLYEMSKVVALNTKPVRSGRTNIGIPQLSTVYGFMPRIAIREDYCRLTKKSKEEEKNFKLSLELNKAVAQFYKKVDKQVYNTAMEDVRAQVLPDYRLTDTPWTNCNVNLNQVIKYHTDSGNIKGDYSNVIIVKEGVEGGYLACPELGYTLAQQDGYMVFFDGQSILHGVTPCTFKGKDSYRCSIVFYTLENLRLCYPYEDELKRVQHVKTMQASQRVANNAKLEKVLLRKKRGVN